MEPIYSIKGLEWGDIIKKRILFRSTAFNFSDQLFNLDYLKKRIVFNSNYIIEISEEIQNKPKSELNGGRKKIFNQEQIDKIHRMKVDKLSNCQIAKIMGVSEKTIRNYLKTN